MEGRKRDRGINSIIDFTLAQEINQRAVYSFGVILLVSNLIEDGLFLLLSLMGLKTALYSLVQVISFLVAFWLQVAISGSGREDCY